MWRIYEKTVDALEFLAEVTQHIPDKGQHLIHYFGWYSNKERVMRKKRELVVSEAPEAIGDGKGTSGEAFPKKRKINELGDTDQEGT